MSSVKLASQIVAELVRFYDKKLSEAQELFYEASMDDCDDDLLCKAIMALKKGEPPNRFPTVATIRKYYLEQKDQGWQRQKRSAPRYKGPDTFQLVPTASFKSFMDLMNGIGKTPKDKWLHDGVSAGIFKLSDADDLKQGWSKMGADAQRWSRFGMFPGGDERNPGEEG